MYVTATAAQEMAVVDATKLRVVAKAPGDFPTGWPTPRVGKVFVSDLRGTGDTIIDARTDQVAGHVELSSDMGNSWERVGVSSGQRIGAAMVCPAVATTVLHL